MPVLKTNSKSLQVGAVLVSLGVSVYILTLRKRAKEVTPVKSETVPYDDRVVIPRWLGANFDAAGDGRLQQQLIPRLSTSTMHVQEPVDAEPSSPRPRAQASDDADVLTNVFSMPLAIKQQRSSSKGAISALHASSPLRPLKPITFLNHHRLIQESSAATPYSPAEH